MKKIAPLLILLSLFGCGFKVKDLKSAQEKNIKNNNAKVKAETGTDLGFEKRTGKKKGLRLTNMPTDY